MKTRNTLAVLCLGTLSFVSNVVWAGSVIWTPPSSCSTLNCNATILHTNITSSFTNPGGSIEPFIIQVHSSPQYCLRLDVTNQTAGSDLEMVLIAPDGTVWKNDNRNPGDRRPLIIVPRGVQGWYTVQLSLATGITGTPGAHWSADLAYGRYTSTTNPNCGQFPGEHPTAPMLPGPGNS